MSQSVLKTTTSAASESKIECGKDYLGHRWSQVPPKKGFMAWCTRCYEPLLPLDICASFLKGAMPTSILNGKPIDPHLVVEEGPSIRLGSRTTKSSTGSFDNPGTYEWTTHWYGPAEIIDPSTL